jgi:hypothetical protein
MSQVKLLVFLIVSCVVVLSLVSNTDAQLGGLRWGRTMQDESMDVKELQDQRPMPGKYWENHIPQRALRKRFLNKKNAGKKSINISSTFNRNETLY